MIHKSNWKRMLRRYKPIETNRDVYLFIRLDGNILTYSSGTTTLLQIDISKNHDSWLNILFCLTRKNNDLIHVLFHDSQELQTQYETFYLGKKGYRNWLIEQGALNIRIDKEGIL